ncbi:Acetyltransferase (GNAT) family protein [Marinomonas spartinae]|uniref:Acetyltransferase (GNAT) family protein n=1 Tax=Marinomonas spartinae TaxID=1792290 RepID=A0A1A8T2R4_9GAMM|nr:GNAT family N-acetyltransferase [Marinomonas spartinae]SBS25637.1 Acetyltransferase (GNAT) family protein [Marinomonas spartinae]
MANKHIGSSFDAFMKEMEKQDNSTLEVSFLADQKHFIPTIAQWYFSEWGYLMPPGKSAVDVENKVTTMAQSRRAFPLTFVLHDKETLLAVAELKFHEHSGYPDYQHWLGGVYVPPAERGKGYSSVILTHAFAHAKTQEIPSLYLQCEQHNITLYLKHEFAVLHTIQDKGVNKAIMVRTF